MAGSLAAAGVTAIPLGRPSPGASSNQPERPGLRTGPALLAGRASLLFGFAPGGACLAADVAADAVRSCRTLSPLPAKGRRFAFCGAVPEIALAGRYPAPCPHGARTFLRPKATAVRPAGGANMRLPAAGSSAATSWPGLTRIKTMIEGLAYGKGATVVAMSFWTFSLTRAALRGGPYSFSAFTPGPPPFAGRRRASAGWRRRARRRRAPRSPSRRRSVRRAARRRSRR